jgi:hypothetical protein
MKSRLTPYLHGATSQKTAFFIVTAVKTSNLIHFCNKNHKHKNLHYDKVHLYRFHERKYFKFTLI